MITLNMTLVATLLVMVLALVFGVWMARQPVASTCCCGRCSTPGQTIPPFVYLIPVLALFGADPVHRDRRRHRVRRPGRDQAGRRRRQGRLAHHARGVSRSTGATTWQEITKVQLPMARGSIVLAANQGLLYVLAMVVIGGLVGAGALGLRRRPRLLPLRGVGPAAPPPASPSCCSGS